MFELLKRLIRWILFAIVVFLLIFLIIKLVNRNKTSVNELKNGTKVVDTVKIKDSNSTTNNSTKTNDSSRTVTIDNNANENKDNTKKETTTTQQTTTTTTVVNTPDTATKDDLFIIFGIAVIGSGIFYVYKNRNLLESN